LLSLFSNNINKRTKLTTQQQHNNHKQLFFYNNNNPISNIASQRQHQNKKITIHLSQEIQNKRIQQQQEKITTPTTQNCHDNTKATAPRLAPPHSA
jgi:hypothetical protein